MAELGKDPRWYSIRSIRQGGTSTACEVQMPELFLRASGGWKGNALERYRKDRLPIEQARFAALISKQKESRRVDTAVTPRNLCGPLGSGGGSSGTTCSPPPSGLASGFLVRGGRRARRAQSSLSRGRAATPPECGDSHTLSSSLVQGDPERAKSWDGAGGARGGGDIPIWLVGKYPWSKEVSSSRTLFLTPVYSSCKDEDSDSEEKLGTSRGE